MDPTFWPMHPTMERLFMFSMLTGQTHDLTWPDSDDSSTNTMISRYGLECNGHGGSDVFPYGLLDTDTDGFEVSICRLSCPASPRIPVTNRYFLLSRGPDSVLSCRVSRCFLTHQIDGLFEPR